MPANRSSLLRILGPALVLGALAGPVASAAAAGPVVGDFNGDGRPDVAIGVPGERSGSDHGGAVQVLYAPAAPYGSRQRLITQSSAGVPGSGEGPDRFGSALAAADVNGDGYCDLAVAEPGEQIGRFARTGAVVILYGSPGGLHGVKTGLVDARAELTGAGDSPAGAALGTSLAFADLNGDGRPDLAAGAPGARISGKSRAGAVAVFGNVDGTVTATPDGAPAIHALTQNERGVPGGSETGDGFGTALAAADFNADGRGDLAVGAPGESVGRHRRAGIVQVFFGSPPSGRLPLGYGARTLTQEQAHGRTESGDAFGAALAAGNVGYDGRPRLAVGVPGEDIGHRGDAGAAMLFAPAAMGSPGIRELDQGTSGIPGSPEPGDAFGAALAVNGFGSRGGLAVGGPGEAVGHITASGAVTILPGTPTGLAPKSSVTWDQSSPRVPGQAERDDAFGAALAPLGVAGLIVGQPGEAIGRHAGAGAVTELRDLHVPSPGGRIVLGSAVALYQGSSVSGRAERGDAFGSAVASG